MTRLVRPLFAVLGGVAWGLCFGNEALVLAPWLALVPLLLLLGSRRAGWLGFLHGIAFWLTSVPWIVPTMHTFGRLPGWLSVVILIGLALLLGANTGLFAWLGSRLWRRGGVLALVGLPALWVAIEWLQTFLWSGFPWNLAGYAWEVVPGALPLAAWVGVYGLSYLAVLANVALALSIVARRPSLWLGVVGICWLLLGFGARWAGGPPLEGLEGPVHEVRLIQPNTANQVEWDPVLSREDYRRLIALSLEACDAPRALVIWPESAAWPKTLDDPQLRSDLERLKRRGCQVILNALSREGEAVYNSALLVDGSRVVERYDKRHLVPYGEYVPMAEWLPFVGTIARMAGHFSPGTEPRLLPWAGEQIGMSICYEVVFGGEVAELVRAGASLLVTITNDAWYGDTTAPHQHFRAARFRAAEMRRPMLRAAVTGITGVIGPDGTVLREIGVFEEGIVRLRVRGGRGLSPVARAPSLVPWACSIAAAFAILLAARRSRQQPSRG